MFGSMNKLRKPKPTRFSSGATMKDTPMSRTMQLALRDDPFLQCATKSTDTAVATRMEVGDTTMTFQVPRGMEPRTAVAQYWALRTMVTETVFSQYVRHQNELTQVRLAEEERRTKEITTLVHANEKRQHNLERLMMALVIFLAYMFWSTSTPNSSSEKRRSATHFTIPILSPFTSVVENETGVLGTKAVVVFVLALVLVAFFTLRRWFAPRTGGIIW
ncbi:hypothetical protein F5J12DRAFT_514440 [Pisolithus orientalis]|uniref:uncharacterized protein n=1 Tax=Pisolithus orientalis TaxID=936130 RepID=UPI002224C0E7|nr:uncharacterized protein F5J12DRAFT_514440 [Pisolithus orientalis]KAI6015042.1 hypothetical protein F5J12DRAFT_514440 [Pisolithus orientalis]